MRAELHVSRGLIVSSLSAMEQGVVSGRATSWIWEVAVRDDFDSVERQYVGASLYALVNIDDRERAVAVQTWHHELEVRITPYQRATRFVGNNWQWLWTTIAAPVAIGMWQWAKRRKRTQVPVMSGRLKLRRPG